MKALSDPDPDIRRAAKIRRIREYRAILRRADYLELKKYEDDPVGFITQKLGGFVWSKQVEIAESVRDNRYTAVRSAHDVGKSYIAALIIAWWLSCHPPGEAFAVSTAPTFSQVRAILWREVGMIHRTGQLPGRVTQTEWHEPDVGIIGYGRKPANWDPAAFQGIHAKYVLAVIDEACGVPRQLYDAVDSIVTNDNSRVLAIGNPDDPSTHFERINRPGSGWNVIRINGLDSPNFTKEKVPDRLRPLLLSKTWVAERVKRWGTENPLYVSKVLGEFPDTSDDQLVPLAWVEAARKRWTEIKELIEDGDPRADEHVGAGRVLGVDVAGGGGDECVIAVRHGRRVWIDYADARSPDTMRLAGEVSMRAAELQVSRIGIDVVGIGWGVADHLALQWGAAGQQMPDGRIGIIERLNAGWGGTQLDTQGDTIYDGIRSEWWWGVRELLDPAEVARTGDWIAIDPEDDELAEQLCAPKWWPTARGKIHVESKDEMRERGIGSPDRADALMFTIARAPAKYQAVLVDGA